MIYRQTSGNVWECTEKFELITLDIWKHNNKFSGQIRPKTSRQILAQTPDYDSLELAQVALRKLAVEQLAADLAKVKTDLFAKTADGIF